MFGRKTNWPIYSQNHSEFPSFVNSEMKLVSEGLNEAQIKEDIEGDDLSHWITILQQKEIQSLASKWTSYNGVDSLKKERRVPQSLR